MYWTLKRNDTQEIIQLHQQFVWVDEFDWVALAQSEPVYTLTGAMDIQQGTKKAGRPISLNGDHAYVPRAVIAQLKDWAQAPELVMTLTHPKGQSFSVIFGRPAIDAIRVFGRAYMPIDTSDDDKFHCTIHLLTV